MESYKAVSDIWRIELINALHESKLNNTTLLVGVSDTYSYIPSKPIHEVKEEIIKGVGEKSNNNIHLNTLDGKTTVFKITNNDTAEAVSIKCFVPYKACYKVALENQYLSKIFHLLDTKLYTVSKDLKTFKTVEPSVGSCSLKRDNSRVKVAICTPVFKRLSVLKCFLEYMQVYMLPHLWSAGYDPLLIITGGLEEKSVFFEYRTDKSVFFTVPNLLGYKKNLMFNFAKDLEFDVAVTIDSDDFIHPSTIAVLIEKAMKNGYWSSIEQFCFMDAKDNRFGVFGGYRKSQSLYKWGMGSGRVFTKKLLDMLGESPFNTSRNHSMDYFIRDNLRDLKIQPKDRLLEKSEFLPIGLKTSQNIWAFGDYPLKDIDSKSPQVSWLPKDIQTQMLDIHFKND